MSSSNRRRLLSAYVDGELSPARKRRIEAILERNPRLAAEFDRLQRTIRAIRLLRVTPLPDNLRRKTVATLLRLSKSDAWFVTDLSPEEADVLLMAYAYGELDASAARDVERVLLTHDDHRQTVDEHRRVGSAIGSVRRQPAPPEVLELLLDRLRQIAAEDPRAKDRGDWLSEGVRKRPFGELLTAYLDQEVPDRKRRKVEIRLAQSDKAREMLGEFCRVHESLSHLPRHAAPSALVRSSLDRIRDEASTDFAEPALISDNVPGNVVLDPDWDRSDGPQAGRNPPSHGWLTTGFAAASLLVASGVVLLLQATTPKSGSPLAVEMPPAATTTANVAAESSGPVVVDETPLPILDDPFAEVASDRDTDLEHLATIGPDALASEIDQKQVTLSANDVDRAAKELELTLDSLSLNPSAIGSHNGELAAGYVLELSVPPGQVSQVLEQLRNMGRRGDLLRNVGIRKPSREMLASVKSKSTQKPTGISPPTRSNSDSIASEISQLARPIRILLVIQSNPKPE